MSNPLPRAATKKNHRRLRAFISDITTLVDATPDEPTILTRGGALLADLVAHDDWLPDEFARAHAERYQQYLLHCDGRERFSIVSFVWGPDQFTPVHDHRVWGLVGVLRGAELNETFTRTPEGSLTSNGHPQTLGSGSVVALSPQGTDIHRVANAHSDRTSISIHVYGANIGAVERATYDSSGQAKRFVSGYANDSLPNVWAGPPA